MLVLSRKQGEKLLIGDDIIITVNWISGDKCSIGIEAPRSVRVARAELDMRKSVPPIPPVVAPSPVIEPTDIPGQFRYA